MAKRKLSPCQASRYEEDLLKFARIAHAGISLSATLGSFDFAGDISFRDDDFDRPDGLCWTRNMTRMDGPRKSET